MNADENGLACLSSCGSSWRGLHVWQRGVTRALRVRGERSRRRRRRRRWRVFADVGQLEDRVRVAVRASQLDGDAGDRGLGSWLCKEGLKAVGCHPPGRLGLSSVR